MTTPPGAQERARLIQAMVDLGWSAEDATEWDDLFGEIVTDAIAQAVQAERERCAKIAESHVFRPDSPDLVSQVARTIAATLRARPAEPARKWDGIVSPMADDGEGV